MLYKETFYGKVKTKPSSIFYWQERMRGNLIKYTTWLLTTCEDENLPFMSLDLSSVGIDSEDKIGGSRQPSNLNNRHVE